MDKHTIYNQLAHNPKNVRFVAPELPGCSAFGESAEEALAEIKVAMALWLETARKENRPIPEPRGGDLLKAALNI